MSALLDTPYARRVTFAFNHQTLAFEGETERKREREREKWRRSEEEETCQKIESRLEIEN
jgi:hypothetical protein